MPLVGSMILGGCGKAANGNEATAPKEESAVEETDVAETVETNDSEVSADQSFEVGTADTGTPVEEQTATTADKTTELVDGMFTLYTRDGAHSVTFPSLGAIMGVNVGTASGTPNLLNPTGSTSEMLNATYGTVGYDYDLGWYSTPEEYLAKKVPSEFTIQAYGGTAGK